jgi:hypothetical protein
MDLNSPLFDRIRIKPQCDEPREAEGPVCERPGCKALGAFRAPKGRSQEGRYFQFCLEHVREYNASYNYFAGMTDAAVAAYQKDAMIGHRPTWAMGVNGAVRPPRAERPAARLGLRRSARRPQRREFQAPAPCAEEPKKPRYSARSAAPRLGPRRGRGRAHRGPAAR